MCSLWSERKLQKVLVRFEIGTGECGRAPAQQLDKRRRKSRRETEEQPRLQG